MMTENKNRFNWFDLLLFILIAVLVMCAIFTAKKYISVSDTRKVTATFTTTLTQEQKAYLSLGAEVTLTKESDFYGTVISYTESGNNEYTIYIALDATYVEGSGYKCGGVRLAAGESYDMRIGMLRLTADCTGVSEAESGTESENG